MTTFIGDMPADGSPEYRELVRRQTAVGIPANTSYSAREQLLRDGAGRHYVSDRPRSVKRPSKLPSNAAIPIAEPRHLLPPVIVATPVGMPPAPRPRHTVPFWKFW